MEGISHISGYVWTISKRSQPHYIYITHIKVVINEKEIPSIPYMQISSQYKKSPVSDYMCHISHINPYQVHIEYICISLVFTHIWLSSKRYPTYAYIRAMPKQYCPYISTYRPHQRDYTPAVTHIFAYIWILSKISHPYLPI